MKFAIQTLFLVVTLGTLNLLSFKVCSWAQTDIYARIQDNFNPYEILLLPQKDLTLTDQDVSQAYRKRFEQMSVLNDNDGLDLVMQAYSTLKTRDAREAFVSSHPRLKTALDIIPLYETYVRQNSQLKDQRITVDNPLKEVWKHFDHQQKEYFLKQAKGTSLELAFLNLIVGLNSRDPDLVSEIEGLIVSRLGGNKVAMSNFIYFLSMRTLDYFSQQPVEIFHHGHFLKITPTAEALRLLAQILVSQNNYWSLSALLDLELDLRLNFVLAKLTTNTSMSLEISAVREVIQDNADKFGGAKNLKLRRGVRSALATVPRTAYGICSFLLVRSNYTIRKAPF